jgi:hypothetical protein
MMDCSAATAPAGQICSAVALLAEHEAGWPSHVKADFATAPALTDAEIAEQQYLPVLRSKHGLVFPTSRGNIIRHEDIIRQGLMPVQVAAGVVGAPVPVRLAGRVAEEGIAAQTSLMMVSCSCTAAVPIDRALCRTKTRITAVHSASLDVASRRAATKTGGQVASLAARGNWCNK